jgi:hypothetical protein
VSHASNAPKTSSVEAHTEALNAGATHVPKPAPVVPAIPPKSHASHNPNPSPIGAHSSHIGAREAKPPASHTPKPSSKGSLPSFHISIPTPQVTIQTLRNSPPVITSELATPTTLVKRVCEIANICEPHVNECGVTYSLC